MNYNIFKWKQKYLNFQNNNYRNIVKSTISQRMKWKKTGCSSFSNEGDIKKIPIPIPNMTILIWFHKKSPIQICIFKAIEQLFLNKYYSKVNNKKFVNKPESPLTYPRYSRHNSISKFNIKPKSRSNEGVRMKLSSVFHPYTQSIY